MKRGHIIALLIIAVAIITITSAIGNTSEFVSFDKAAARPNKEYKVIGVWHKEKGLEYDALNNPNYFAFYLKDEEGKIMKVVFRSNKPQDFERSENVVVTGKVTPEHFEASSILMKCPSKYNDTTVKVKDASEASK